MNPERLREARLQRGHNQQQAATALGVTQAYYSMLESGARKPSLHVARRMMDVYGVSATVLPVPSAPASYVPKNFTPDALAYELASLGYPGFAHLHRRGVRRMNPAEYLLSALSRNDLEARVAEALPWLVVRYPDMNFAWLLPQARMANLQNRLGFAVTLARLATASNSLRQHEQALAESKLQKEDSFCRNLNEPERRWLREHRSEEAREWNLLSDLRPDMLRYV